MITNISEDYIDNMLKEITRHIIFHDCFDCIDIDLNPSALTYEIECHCGEHWTIRACEIIHCNVEAEYIVNFIEGLNTPEFHAKLIKMKEAGNIKASKKAELLVKTESPTISFLEI